MRKWLFGGLLANLVLVGCVLTTWLPNQMPESRPDAFQLTATKVVADATRFATMGITPTPGSFALTLTAISGSLTAIVPTLDAICPERTVNYWEINYFVSIDEPHTWISEINRQRESPPVCPDYAWPFEHYIYIWTDSSTPTTTYIIILEEAIGTLSEYPPEDDNAGDNVQFIIQMPMNGKIFNGGHFTYEEAIAAYESGLRGEDLLDALGIILPPEE